MQKKKMITCQEGESQHITVPYRTVFYSTIRYHSSASGECVVHVPLLWYEYDGINQMSTWSTSVKTYWQSPLDPNLCISYGSYL